MHSQIINPEIIKRLRPLIDNAERPVITTHMSPDGDAVGSALGLFHALSEMGKSPKIIVPDEPSRQLMFLPGAKEMIVYCKYVKFATELIENADLIFCIDYNDLKRIDRVGPAVETATATKVMIDHHLNPSPFCDITISHPELSSASIVLFHTLCQLELFDAINRDAATCIMAGMMTDTGNFSYNANDPEIYLVVADLLQKGVDRNELSRKLFDVFSENCIRLNGYAVSRKMEVWKEYGAAMISLTRDELNRYHYSRGDTEGLVNRPLAIPGVVYSVFLREEDSYIKVSMRSLGEFPCDAVCKKYFNGGGHKNASGGEFRGSMEQCIAVVKSILKENKELYIK